MASAAARWRARLEAVSAAHVFREAGGSAEVVDAATGRTVRLRGLTGAMAAHLYVPVKPATRPAPRPTRGKAQYLTAKGARVLGCRGAMRGTLVHAHVYYLWLYRDNEAAFRALYPDGPHPWALRVLHDMLDRGWQPLACEVPVYNAALRLWTKVDLKAVDLASGRLLSIELKTGYERGGWDIVDGQWRPESQLRRLACTPKHRAMVQATLGALLAVRLLGIADVAAELETWVVQVNDETGVTWTHVPLAFVHEDGHRLYGVLARAAAAATLPHHG